MKEPDRHVINVRIDVGKEAGTATHSQREQDDVPMIDQVPAISRAKAGNVHIEVHEHARRGIEPRGLRDGAPVGAERGANNILTVT
jgi:hypothetical protein